MFLFDRGDIVDRLDPKFLKYTKRENLFRYPARRLGKLLLKGPEYGAGEPGIERTDANQLRYIRITDINNFGLLQNGLGATVEFADSRYLLHDQDLLIARSGNTVGKSYLHRIKEVPEQSIFAGYLIRFVLDKAQALPEYVFTLAQLPLYKDWVDAIQRPSGQPNINAEEYRSWHLPVPSLEQQGEIVARMRQAYEVFLSQEKAAQALLVSLDNYLLSELGIKLPPSEIPEKIFYSSWQHLRCQRWDAFFNQPQFDGFEQAIREGRYPSEKLRTQCQAYRGVVYSQEDETEEGHIILRGNNIDLTTNELDLTDLRYINGALSLSASQKLYAGDILMSAASGSKEHVGKVAYIEENTGMYFGGFMMCLRTQPTINARFLFEFLQSNLFRKVLFRLLGGTSINNLNFSMIASVPVPVPPIEDQERISEYLRKLRQQARQQRQQAAADFTAAKAEIESLILA